MTLAQRQEDMIASINAIGDCLEQYSYLIMQSARLPVMSDEDRREAYLVPGCQSKVWMKISGHDGHLHLEMDSDTLIIRGILALFIELLEGCSVEEVYQTELTLLEQTELAATFTSDRDLGVRSILFQIKQTVAN